MPLWSVPMLKGGKGPPKNFELWSSSTKFWKCAFFYQPCHLSFQESSPRIRNAQVNKERYCEVHILPCIPSSFFSCHITRLAASLLPTSFCHWNQSLYPYPFKTYWRFYIACTFISSIQCSDSWLEPKMSLNQKWAWEVNPAETSTDAFLHFTVFSSTFCFSIAQTHR